MMTEGAEMRYYCPFCEAVVPDDEVITPLDSLAATLRHHVDGKPHSVWGVTDEWIAERQAERDLPRDGPLSADRA